MLESEDDLDGSDVPDEFDDEAEGEEDEDAEEEEEGDEGHVEVSHGWTRVGSLMVPTSQAKVIDDASEASEPEPEPATASETKSSCQIAPYSSDDIAAALSTAISGSTAKRSEQFDWSVFDDDEDDVPQPVDLRKRKATDTPSTASGAKSTKRRRR